jgi:hypothetical protein
MFYDVRSSLGKFWLGEKASHILLLLRSFVVCHLGYSRHSTGRDKKYWIPLDTSQLERKNVEERSGVCRRDILVVLFGREVR